MSKTKQLFEQLQANYDEIVTARRYLHKHPELSFKETNTARYIAEKLRCFNIEVREHVGGNGVLGFIKGKIRVKRSPYVLILMPYLFKKKIITSMFQQILASCMLVATMGIQQACSVSQKYYKTIVIY